MDVNPPVTVRARVARTASGTHQGRYRPIDIDRSPWDVFCDSFGLGTDDSWGIEMSQFSCPHTVSPSQCEAPAEPHPCRNALCRSLLLCKIAANRSQRGPAFGGSAGASPSQLFNSLFAGFQRTSTPLGWPPASLQSSPQIRVRCQLQSENPLQCGEDRSQRRRSRTHPARDMSSRRRERWQGRDEFVLKGGPLIRAVQCPERRGRRR